MKDLCNDNFEDNDQRNGEDTSASHGWPQYKDPHHLGGEMTIFKAIVLWFPDLK